jgi:Fe-S cluster biogenesis protein NfuA
MATSFEFYDRAKVDDITDDPDTLEDIALMIEGDQDFNFIRDHNANLRVKSFRGDKLEIELFGAACSGCAVANIGTIRSVTNLIKQAFSTVDVNITILPNVAPGQTPAPAPK